MRQHIGESNPSSGKRSPLIFIHFHSSFCVLLCLSEELCDISYHDPHQNDPFHLLWSNQITINSNIYDWLDGEDISIYRCERLSQLKDGLQRYIHKSSFDSVVMERMTQIKGFIIHWPIHFLKNENLSPPLKLRPLAASNLWL